MLTPNATQVERVVSRSQASSCLLLSDTGLRVEESFERASQHCREHPGMSPRNLTWGRDTVYNNLARADVVMSHGSAGGR